MSRQPKPSSFQFFGGRQCVDFANTVHWRTSKSAEELIPNYDVFLTWCEDRGVLPRARVENYRALSLTTKEQSEKIFREALVLRADLWDIFEALRERQDVDLERLNRLLEQAPRQEAVFRSEENYFFAMSGTDLREPLWPIVWSLTSVLTSSDAVRIGRCEGEGCGWYFVDESPNRTRRWCSSAVCGNRERARRAYQKRPEKKA